MENTNSPNISIVYKNDQRTKDAFINMIIDYMLDGNFLRKEQIDGTKNNS